MNSSTRTPIDELLATLRHQLAQPGHSLLPLLSTMSRFSKYSLSNQLLIFAQRPDATRVLGYRAWANAGYQVRKGEKGIAIYAPMLFAKRDFSDELDETAAAPRLRYRVAYVFDIAQVDRLAGADTSELPSVPAVSGSTTALRPLEQLKAFLVGHNIELDYQPLQPGLYGYTDGRRITCGTDQASHVEFATLAHETTHVLLHFPADRSTRPDLVTRETEAEAVSYLLCAQLGLDGTEASIEYIQAYRGTPDTLDASLERVRSTAQRLATELDAILFADIASTASPVSQAGADTDRF